MIHIGLRGITERDIDLLIVEELVASPAFSRWFATQAGLALTSTLDTAARSVVTSTGESDLEVTYLEKGVRTRLLVENKIDAAFQRRQAPRYAERAAAYLKNGDCERAVTVVVAPASYAATITGFDATITYESVRDWFAAAAPGDARMRYKLALLDEAISRGESGWRLVPDHTATSFWNEYWKLASEVAPELNMPRPGIKPATSSFVRFRPLGLPKGVALIHKVSYGNVDLQFAGRAGKSGTFTARFEKKIERGMSIARAGKSLVVRITVAPVSIESSFSPVQTQVRAGLGAAARLLAWYRRVVGPVRAK